MTLPPLTSVLDLLTVGPEFMRPACRAAAAVIDRYLRGTYCRRPISAVAETGQADGWTLDRFMMLAA